VDYYKDVISSLLAGTWNPAWSVSTILTGLLSFMLEETPTTGSVSTTVSQRRMLAMESRAWNRKNVLFRAVFAELCEQEVEVSSGVKRRRKVTSPTIDKKPVVVVNGHDKGWMRMVVGYVLLGLFVYLFVIKLSSKLLL
jgi:hypothetical protein